MANRHRVQKNCKKILEKFISLFDDYPQKHNLPETIYLAGGSIYSMLADETPNDYDIFFDDRESLNNAIEYLKTKHKNLIVSQTKNAVTLKNKYQIIVKYVDDPSDLVKKFDFAHCACYYLLDTDELFIHELATESIATKSLIFLDTPYPISSMFRLRKLLSNGWTIPNGQMLKMILACQAINLNAENTLDDQLSGLYDSIIGEDDIHLEMSVNNKKLFEFMDSQSGTHISGY